MAHAKYTRQMLSEAVAASTSMAGVLRHLGLRQNGGAHAHLRRRIDQFSIDTSHFLGSAHSRGTHSLNRRSAEQILILRPATANRAKPLALRRALIEIGRPYHCAQCGIGNSWHGRPLVLHVDHIDGRLWDCRPENVRFLCPNCHSQTSTYAGRKSRQNAAALVPVDGDGNPVVLAPPSADMAEEDVQRVLERVERREIGASQAAQLIGCARRHIYTLQKRLTDRGSVAPTPRRPPLSDADRRAIVAFALANPESGPRRTSQALGNQQPEPLAVSPSTISNVLGRADLGNKEKRQAAAAQVERRVTV